MNLELKDWLIIAATILGPVLAVQAQKAVEIFRERRGRKMWVFQTLMATRAARLSAEHVQALNMIDIVFYGNRTLLPRRSAAEQRVLDAWKEYLDHLGTKVEDKDLSVWTANGNELFVNLLFAISQDLRYSFDRVVLKKGAYSPMAHGDLEFEQNLVRKLAIRVLSGDRPLKMSVSELPINEQALSAQLGLSQKLADALDGRGALAVIVRTAEEKSQRHPLPSAAASPDVQVTPKT